MLSNKDSPLDDEKSIQSPSSSSDASEQPEEDAQNGVKAAEAITMAWNKKWLIVAYVW